MNNPTKSTNSLSRQIAASFALAVLVAAPAFADTLVMTSDGNGESKRSYYTANGWSDNLPPGSGNDYVVANGYVMAAGSGGADSSTRTFGGDSLQIGYVGGTEGVLWPIGPNKLDIANLILANGYVYSWRGSGYVGSFGYIKGATTVTAPASAPFRIYPTYTGGSNTYNFQWDATISGAVGTGLYFGPYPGATTAKPILIIAGDNSSYFGTWVASGAGAKLQIKTPTALGGALPAFNPAALTLQNQAILQSVVDSLTLSSAANRGITVEATGGGIRLEGTSRTFCIEWPVSGSGSLEKTGDGTIELASAWNTAGDVHTADLVIREGGVRLAAGFANGTENAVTVGAGGTLSIASGDTVPVRSLVFEEGGVLSVVVGSSGVLELADASALSGKIAVAFTGAHGVTMPFLRVATSVGTLSPEQIIVTDASVNSFDQPKFTVSVVEADGYSVASVTTFPVVTPAEGTNTVYATKISGGWSDNALPHNGADYMIDYVSANVPREFHITAYGEANPADYTFPGGALYLRGKSTSYRTFFYIRQKNLTIDDLRTGECVQIRSFGNTAGVNWAGAGSTGDQHVLRGNILVDNTAGADAGLDFRSGYSRTTTIESTIRGPGAMSFQPYATGDAANFVCTYVLAGTNTFTGPIFIYNSKSSSSCVTLRFSAERNFGVNPSSFLQGGVKLDGSGAKRLHPIGSVRVALSNREFHFYLGSNNVKVDEGDTFELASPVRYSKGVTINKEGGGTFAVCGEVSVDDVGTAKTLNVNEGFIRADNARAFTAMKTINFADGTGIVTKYDPAATGERTGYGMIVTNAAAITIAGATLPVQVITGGERVRGGTSIAALTVPSTAADAIDAKITFSCDAPSLSVQKVRESLTLDGDSYVRFSALLRRGTKIIFR